MLLSHQHGPLNFSKLPINFTYPQWSAWIICFRSTLDNPWINMTTDACTASNSHKKWVSLNPLWPNSCMLSVLVLISSFVTDWLVATVQVTLVLWSLEGELLKCPSTYTFSQILGGGKKLEHRIIDSCWWDTTWLWFIFTPSPSHRLKQSAMKCVKRQWLDYCAWQKVTMLFIPKKNMRKWILYLCYSNTRMVHCPTSMYCMIDTMSGIMVAIFKCCPLQICHSYQSN